MVLVKVLRRWQRFWFALYTIGNMNTIYYLYFRNYRLQGVLQGVIDICRAFDELLKALAKFLQNFLLDLNLVHFHSLTLLSLG